MAPRRSMTVFAVPAHAAAQRTRRTGQATALTAPTVGAEVDLANFSQGALAESTAAATTHDLHPVTVYRDRA